MYYCDVGSGGLGWMESEELFGENWEMCFDSAQALLTVFVGQHGSKGQLIHAFCLEAHRRKGTHVFSWMRQNSLLFPFHQFSIALI